MKPLSLDDLKPAEAKLELSGAPGVALTLKKFSLADRLWAQREFGDRLKGILETRNIGEIAKLVFHLIKEKDAFKTFGEFTEAVVSLTDQMAIYVALLATIGIDDALLKTIAEEKSPESPMPSPNQTTV